MDGWTGWSQRSSPTLVILWFSDTMVVSGKQQQHGWSHCAAGLTLKMDKWVRRKYKYHKHELEMEQTNQKIIGPKPSNKTSLIFLVLESWSTFPYCFLLGPRYAWVKNVRVWSVLFALFIWTVRQPKPRGERTRVGRERSAAVGWRALQYGEPLEGSKCPWRRKRKNRECGGWGMGQSVPGGTVGKCHQILTTEEDKPPDRAELLRLVSTWLVSNNPHVAWDCLPISVGE